MKLVYRHQEGGDRPSPGIRRTSLLLVAALALLAGGTAGANAAPASHSAAASQSSFCSIAAGVAATVVNPSSELTPTAGATSLVSLEAKLKTIFQKFEAAEPGLIGAAPGPIKVDLRKVFGVDNTLFQDLKKANWNFLALAADAKSLQVSENGIKRPLGAIEAYLKSTCGIKA